MKTSKILKASAINYALCIMSYALMASCSTDDLATSEPTSDTRINVTVTDGGFNNPDGTRATENGYTTTFTSGDKIGVFAVVSGKVGSHGNNVCMTYDGSSWTGDLYDIPGATYYAYYPYQETLTGDLVPTASTADDFFANVITNWQVQSDQKSYTNYTKSDLMVAKGTVSSGNLALDMAHKMRLVEIKLPRISFTIDESTTVTVPTEVAWSNGFAPYTTDINEGFCRYITNSEQAISGTYNDGNKLFTFTPSIERGQYKTYIVKDDGSFTGTVVNLSSEISSDEIGDNTLVTGTNTSKTLKIADGARVTLYNLSLGQINCNGSATIHLDGENTVAGGIVVANQAVISRTLTIEGNGKLTAKMTGLNYGRCGIGGVINQQAGNSNIVINGGILDLEGSKYCAGIGSATKSSCGSITINGGTITTTGGETAAGIGSGNNNASCGKITINGGTIIANGGYIALNTDETYEYSGVSSAGIGSGDAYATCGDIEITGGIITTTGGPRGAGIGSGSRTSKCGNITISGGTITATGGQYAAGIGSGNQGNNSSTGVSYSSTCGTITITSGVDNVTVTKGSDATDYIGIGSGSNSTCGTVTIADGAKITYNK